MSQYSNNRNGYTVRNKGKRVGKSRAYKENMKRLSLLGLSYVVLTTTGFFVGRATKDTKEIIYSSYDVVSDEAFDEEPTYNGIEYTVRAGDTLTNIVFEYEDDANKVFDHIERICDDCGIKNSSDITSGMQIKLIGVPESRLENYGYSADYSLFAPELELEDRIKFLKVTEEDVSSYDVEDVDLSVYMYRLSQLIENHQEYLSKKDDETLDELLNESRSLCYELKDLTGIDFEYNKKAYPLSKAINYEPTTLGY